MQETERKCALRGRTPVTRVADGARQKLSMISTVTNQDKARWMIIDSALNHEKCIEFLQTLIDGTERKLFVIMDNFGIHAKYKARTAGVP